jgi:hypothetical protein
MTEEHTLNVMELDSGNPNKLAVLTSPEGGVAWISTDDASLDQLILPVNKIPVNLVYGHNDVVNPGRDRNDPLVYTKQCHGDMLESRAASPMAGGVPMNFFPGRLRGGQMWFLQPGGEYEKFAVPNSHPQFDSLLHLGDGKGMNFNIISPYEGDAASVTFVQEEIGNSLYNKGFPTGMSANVRYTLKEGVLERRTIVTNRSDVWLGIPFSDHGSYLPGNGMATDLSVVMKVDGEFKLDKDTKVATGLRKGQYPKRLNRLNSFKVKGPMEHMYSLAGTTVEILNSGQGCGVRIDADSKTKTGYVWVPGNPNAPDEGNDKFISFQGYSGLPTAAFSLPAFHSRQGYTIDPVFEQTIAMLIPPHTASEPYVQTFSAINAHHRNDLRLL